MFLFIIFLIVLYIVLAAVFVHFVRKRTPNTLYQRLAIAFVILLPSWDVILGFLVYYPACLIVPTVAIYETAVTDGIYYKGMNDYLLQQQAQRRDGDEFKLVGTGWIANGIEEGFLHIEYMSENRTIYECTKLEKNNPINKNAKAICRARNSINSKYEVKVSTLPIGITEIEFKKVYERNTGKLMAEFNRAVRWGYYGLIGIPFFNWLDWGWGSKEEFTSRCPSSNQDYESFEYRVLMPNK